MFGQGMVASALVEALNRQYLENLGQQAYDEQAPSSFGRSLLPIQPQLPGSQNLINTTNQQQRFISNGQPTNNNSLNSLYNNPDYLNYLAQTEQNKLYNY